MILVSEDLMLAFVFHFTCFGVHLCNCLLDSQSGGCHLSDVNEQFQGCIFVNVTQTANGES